MMNSSGTDKQRRNEIFAVLLTAAPKFIFMDALEWKLPYIIASVVGWSGYLIYRSRTQPETLVRWGFRTDNFKKVTRMVLPFGAIAVASFFITGYFLDTINLNWHIIPILILYPIWGVIQQFLVIALMAGNLQDMNDQKLSKSAIIVLTAALFSVVHYPYYWLMLGTFLLALYLWVHLFKRAKHLCTGLVSWLAWRIVLLYGSQSRSFCGSVWQVHPINLL